MSLETYRRAVQQFAPGSELASSTRRGGAGTVRSYRGRTLDEARDKAELELGNGFTVVATRSIPRDGVFGFFGAEEFEISVSKKAEPLPEPSRAPFPETHRQVQGPAESELTAIRNEVRSEVRSLRSLLTRVSDAPSDSSKRRNLESEIAELRETLDDLRGERDTPAQMKRRIAAAGIEGHAARAIVAKMRELGQKGSDADVMDAVTALTPVSDWPLGQKGRILVSLVGPTGVGKTTTAAKLAAHAILEQGRSVTLISCDGFRVGATAQMERYAELLGAELQIATTAAELEGFVSKSKTDVTIVDTGGRGPAERNSVEAAIARLRISGPSKGSTQHTLLCAPACTRDADARRMQRFFSACRPTGLVITKIDETATPAGIVHAALANELPIAALCFGQRVPEDISSASSESILEVLFGDRTARKSRDRS